MLRPMSFPTRAGTRRHAAAPVLTAALLFQLGHASAQQAGGYDAAPGKGATYQAVVEGHRRSREATPQPPFAGPRFWRLDPGRFEVEQWWRVRQHRDGSGSEHLLQTEIEIGLSPHIQIDIYENLQVQPGQQIDQEGNQIEMRYSIASSYGQIWGNPTLYLEWHPRHNAPDRPEGRVLIGGTPFFSTWVGAAS